MESNPSNTADFLLAVSAALTRLKREFQRDYEQAYPALREIIHLVLDEEETKAWDLSSFPHLIFPDLVQAHIATLNLRPLPTHHHQDVTPAREAAEFPIYHEPAFA
jgi:hypothetical protein